VSQVKFDSDDHSLFGKSMLQSYCCVEQDQEQFRTMEDRRHRESSSSVIVEQ